MSEREIGYVVVEFNQASGQPSIASEMFDDEEHAETSAGLQQGNAQLIGRRERYAVGTVTIKEDQ